jgi:hypothetical protein
MKANNTAKPRRGLGRQPAWLLGLFSICLSVLGHAATSGVVGFYQVQIPQGNSLWVPGLVGLTLYEGAAATVSADVDGKALVTFSSPGWTGGEFTKHYAEPQSGTGSGLAIDILSNTTDTLKLNSTPAAAGLANGMVFIVRKHATLAGLLPDGGGFQPFADTISVFNTSGQQTNYFYSTVGSNWINTIGQDSGGVVIRPGQGIVIQVSTVRTVTLGKGEICHVKTTPTKVSVNPGVPNLLGPIIPLGGNTTLGSLGMVGSLQAFNDSVLTVSQGSLTLTGTYLSTGSAFINGQGQNSNNVALPSGSGVVVNVNAAKNITLSPVTVSP